jgi:hypothetical protein
MLLQRSFGGVNPELVNRTPGDHRTASILQSTGDLVRRFPRFVGDDQFGRTQPNEFVHRLPIERIQHPQSARSQFRRGHPDRGSLHAHPRQDILTLLVEQGFVSQGAGCDDAHHLAADHALGLAGVFHLFGDGHVVAGVDQLIQIAVEGVIGNSSKRNRVGIVFVARGQRDPQHPRRLDRVVVEQFIKIPHAKQQQGIAHLLLLLGVLPHRGRFAPAFGFACLGRGTHRNGCSPDPDPDRLPPPC